MANHSQLQARLAALSWVSARPPISLSSQLELWMVRRRSTGHALGPDVDPGAAGPSEGKTRLGQSFGWQVEESCEAGPALPEDRGRGRINAKSFDTLNAALCALAVVASQTLSVALFLAAITFGFLVEHIPGIRAAVTTQLNLIRETQERIAHLLRDTEQQLEAGLPGDFESLAAFFTRSKAATQSFSNDALSLKSMALYFKSDASEHLHHLRGIFEEHIFKAADLEREVHAAPASYEARVSRAENALLFRLRENGLNFPASPPLFPDLDRKKLRATSEKALVATAGQAGEKARTIAASEIITISAAQTTPQISKAFRAAMVIRGTRISWPTLVLSLLVGWGADKYFEGQVAAQLERRLDEIHTLIVSGSHDVSGLRRQLQRHARERAELRASIVFSHIRTHNGWASWCWWKVFDVLQPQASGLGP